MSKGKILSKSPCNADLFEGKAHEKLAKTIADEIVSDENCTIIGIDGGWGSGKSNLVGMVEKYLTGETPRQKINTISLLMMLGGIRMTFQEDLYWRNLLLILLREQMLYWQKIPGRKDWIIFLPKERRPKRKLFRV